MATDNSTHTDTAIEAVAIHPALRQPHP